MTELNVIAFLDIMLGSMVILHIMNSIVISRRHHKMLKNKCGCRMTTFKILCNRMLGPEQMGWFKMTSTTLLIGAFLMLTLYGSFFGLISLATVGVLGAAKIYYSLHAHIYKEA